VFAPGDNRRVDLDGAWLACQAQLVEKPLDRAIAVKGSLLAVDLDIHSTA
jgi:hypothetical protein